MIQATVDLLASVVWIGVIAAVVVGLAVLSGTRRK